MVALKQQMTTSVKGMLITTEVWKNCIFMEK